MKWILRLMLFALCSCAGVDRACSATCASGLGADWIVVQYTMAGDPIRCWKLEAVSVSNETNSDGIYWLSEDGNLVHISSQYNMVQVEGERWREGFAELGLTESLCEDIHDRRYSLENGGWRFPVSPPPTTRVLATDDGSTEVDAPDGHGGRDE